MPINKFTTLLDLSRQSKIITGETATFDGKIQAGIPFSGYPTGVNVATKVSLGIVSNQNAVLSGNTGTTVFDVANPLSPNYNPSFDPFSGSTWSNPLFSVYTSGLTLPITPLSAETQTVGPFWTLTQTGYTGDYIIGTQYTGYSITYSFNNIVSSGGIISGITNAIQENFSAGTLDYKGPLDYISSKENITVDGRLITNKITITDGASSATTNYILTQIDDTGKGSWSDLSSVITGICFNTLNVTNLKGCSPITGLKGEPITVWDSVQSTGSSATGITSFAFGNEVIASGYYSHAEGNKTTASGNKSHAEGNLTLAIGLVSHAEGSKTSAVGDASHAEGSETIASGDASHAEGSETIASGDASHAEGSETTASGDYSHAEGTSTIASGQSSHSEGQLTTASGNYSHAEGIITSASGLGSHSEGVNTLASGNQSHAEGGGTISQGANSHAEGGSTRSVGTGSHAEGLSTSAITSYSHSEGYGTITYEPYQHVSGRWNNTTNANQYFIIGRGTSNAARANAFRVDSAGNVYGAGATYNSGADYAEYFESLSGDSLPFGTVVELEDDKIKVCVDANNAIGVISSNPTLIGNNEDGTADEWVGKYEKDEWGRYVMEDYSYEIPDYINESGDTIYKTITEQRPKISNNFDPNLTYTPRSQRPEWNVVGLVGQVRILKNQQIPSRWIKMKDINTDIALYLIR